MDPHLLRTFVTVIRSGSFSAAAAELRYTQSAVSQQIAALEADLGAPLLTRRPVAPTDAGIRLLDHADGILMRLDAARADVARTVAGPAERLTLVASPLAMARATAHALADLRVRMPRLDVSVHIAGRDAVVAGVATGAYDIGLVDGIAAPNDPLRLRDVGALARRRIVEREACVVMPSEHPMAGRNAIRLADLVDARWLDAPDVAAPLAMLRAAVGADRLRSVVRFEGTDVGALLALVAAGHGMAVLPHDCDLPRGVTAVPIGAPHILHRVEALHGQVAPEPATWLAARLGG